MRHDEGVLAEIAALAARVSALEAGVKRRAVRPRGDGQACDATDPFAARMMVQAVAAGFKNTRLVRCAPDYYSWTLEARRDHLGAATTDELCKSIVMVNSRAETQDCSNFLNSRYYCVVVQYRRKLRAEDLGKVLKKLNAAAGNIVSAKQFNFRLAEDCEELTGYMPNGVTPLGLRTPMPIILDRDVAKLESAWLGGGEVDLKWRVCMAEFVSAFKPIVGDVTPEEDE
jgi:prolyl-tRNA editing enzyme YbaK/EbsC (Cys-tRNA(Pro) deacylase)